MFFLFKADEGEEAAAVEDLTTAATVADREGVADVLAPDQDSGSGTGQDDIVPNEDEPAYGANVTMDHSTEV